MSGFAFAAIYKEPTPGPGPGPGPGPSPDPGPDPEPEPTYTISGESITPFVPFTVTVTGSNSKAKGNHGNMQADIDYEILDGGAWEGGKCEWTLGTRVCDSKRTNSKFSWLISGREPVTATLAYDAGTMEPDIEDSSVVLGKTFDFSITFSGAGDDCYATRLGDFGASYWWEAYKNGKWEKTTRIAESQIRFSKGVLSGVGYVGNLAGYEKIRLCVNYAGLETAYDEATVTSAEVTITLGDDALHCWGAGTQLKIESDTLEYMTAAFYRGGDTTEDITDTQGDPIVFGFTGTSWQGDIQAAGGATAGTVTLKVFYNNEVVATKTIEIVTAIYGDIEAVSSAIQGDTVTVTGNFDGGDYELTRLPAGVVKLRVKFDGEVVASSDTNGAGEEYVSMDFTPSNGGIYIIELVDLRGDGVVMDDMDLTVQNVYEALAEAINERMAVKHVGILVDYDYNETNYTGIEGATYLAQYAKTAMLEFAKIDWNEANGSYTRYADNNTDISLTKPEAMTEVQWMKDCYNKVCSAKILVGNTSGWGIDGICAFRYETKKGRGSEQDSSKSQSEVVNAAKSKANANYGVSETGSGHDVLARTGVSKYESYYCICEKEYTRTKAYCNYSFPTANTIKIFFQPNQLYSVFDDFGGNLTIDSCPCLITFSQAANQHGSDSDNNWAEGPAPFFRDADNGDTSVSRGYRISLKGMNISFNFKHK